jgi:hypothetical protein
MLAGIDLPVDLPSRMSSPERTAQPLLGRTRKRAPDCRRDRSGRSGSTAQKARN